MARFVYYNQNLDGLHISDCVTRALVSATGLSYPGIRKKLYYCSRLWNCPKLDVLCYCHLLDDYFKFPRVETRGMTVEEFADAHPQGMYLVRMPQHISVVYNNNVIDIFDCLDYEITDAWFCGY